MGNAGKAYKVVVSNRAAEQLVSHIRFLAQVSEQAAERLRLDVLDAAAALQNYPERNPWLHDPMLPEHKYRKMPIDKRYMLLYQIGEDIVFIEYILDCRQDYQWLT